jgi:hypothetical protein
MCEPWNSIVAVVIGLPLFAAAFVGIVRFVLVGICGPSTGYHGGDL